MNLFLINTLEQGFIFGIVALGVYITYKILDFPDLSVDGTFPLGAAITALCLTKGVNPVLACLFAVCGGLLAGAITGVLHVKLKITNLLSGILVMIALYSINLRIMGRVNVQFFNYKTIFSGTIKPVIILGVVCILCKVLLDLFLNTKLGFLLKAVGDNEQLVTSLGVNKNLIKVVGLMISNALVALAGSIMAQYQGFADVGMGTGTVVTGLAAVILGEAALKKFKNIRGTTNALLGAILYKLALAGALKLNIDTQDFKLVTALIVIVILGSNNLKIKSMFKIKSTKTQGGEKIAPSAKSI